EHQPLIAKRLAELAPGDARFDRRIEIFGADAENPVHLPKIDRDAALDRVHVPLERRARAKRHDRDLIFRAELQDTGHFFGRVWETNDVGRGGNMVRLAVSMVLADGGAVVDPRAEQRLELGNGGVNRPRTDGWSQL